MRLLIINMLHTEPSHEQIQDNGSPAAIMPLLLWPNGSQFWTQDIDHNCTFTINTPLPENFNIHVVIRNTGNEGTSCMVIGLSTKVLDTKSRYLGGDLGPGSWSISGNGSCGEDRTWKFHRIKYIANDIYIYQVVKER